MSHEIFGGRFYSLRQPAWHGLGLVLDEEMGAQDAFSKIGPYDVELRDLQTTSGLEVPYRVIVREALPDDPEERVFGVVGPKYTLIPPHEICVAWDEAVGQSVETIGAIKNGSILFVTTRLPDYDVKGDEINNYIMLYSPMSGIEAIQIRITPVRPVCWNTIIAAKRASTEVYRVVHDDQAYERLTKWLSSIYENALQKSEALKEWFEIFANHQMVVDDDVDEVARVLQAVYPGPKPIRRDAPPEVVEKREGWNYEAQDAARRYRGAVTELFEGEGQGIEHPAAAGTAWGLYNSVVEWEDYHGRRDHYQESQLASALFGDRAYPKERAFVELTRVCEGS